MGEGPAASHAHSLRGAGSGGAGARRLPAAPVRQPGDEGNAGGGAPAFLSGQSARRFELAEGGGLGRILDARGPGADVPARRQIVAAVLARAGPSLYLAFNAISCGLID